MATIILAGLITYWGFGVDRLGGNFIVFSGVVPIEERRVFGFLASSVPTIFVQIALWHLFMMFRQYSQTKLVALRTISHLRAFAKYSLLTVISAFLLSGVMRWAMGVFDDAPLWTHLGFSITHLVMLFSSAIIYIATYLIEEGYRHGQEIQEYV
ncbi:MAG: hypothetical protein ABJ269_15925 [Parasphingorhabdus sp.]|uniref:hypothetical protein n=1 Tax=Parasphingorhabdus sp. TaxID=2709688 RepID=UPI003263C0EB